MEESREAIFIREVLQDGRATNILAMLTGSLIVATAVFSLLAAQARARSIRPIGRSEPSPAWVSQSDWTARGDLQVTQAGTIQFTREAAQLTVPLDKQQNDLYVRLVQDHPGQAVDRLSIQLIDNGGRSVTILPAREQGFEMWTGTSGSPRELIAWNYSTYGLSRLADLEIQWNGKSLTVEEGDQILLEYHHLPLQRLSSLVLAASAGQPFSLTLSLR